MRLISKPDIDRIQTCLLKFKLLDIDDKIPGQKMRVIGQIDGDRHFNRRHDIMPVGIYEDQAQLAMPLIARQKSQTQSHRTLGMDRWHLRSVDCVKSAQEA